MEGRFLPVKEVMKISSLSRTTIWRRVQEGAFPKPISLGGNRTAWIEEEVQDWRRRLIEQSRSAASA